MADCPTCGALNDDAASFCTLCYTPLRRTADGASAPHVPTSRWGEVVREGAGVDAGYVVPREERVAAGRAPDVGSRLNGLAVASATVSVALLVLLAGGTANAAFSSFRRASTRIVRPSADSPIVSWAQYPRDVKVPGLLRRWRPTTSTGRVPGYTGPSSGGAGTSRQNASPGGSSGAAGFAGDSGASPRVTGSFRTTTGMISIDYTMRPRAGTRLQPSLRVDVVTPSGARVTGTSTVTNPGHGVVGLTVPAGNYRLSISARSCDYEVRVIGR